MSEHFCTALAYGPLTPMCILFGVAAVIWASRTPRQIVKHCKTNAENPSNSSTTRK